MTRRRFWSLITSLGAFGLLLASPVRGEEADSEHRWVTAVPDREASDSLQPYTSHAPPLMAENAGPDSAPFQHDETPSIQSASPSSETLVPPAVGAPYPVIVNERVEYFLERFQAPDRRAIISLWLNRSGRYLEMIRTVFKTHGLPEELAYVAMIESGFNPVAVSRAGAKGLWQFMEQTARRYGLRVDRWVDERLDPEKSTVAAARHLRDLFEQFGSWFLAKAAYNAGELKVAQAIARSRTTDFWSLIRSRVLREETKRFVPAILAAMLIGQDPERYGFEINPEPPLAYDVVMAPPLLRLKNLASRAGLSLDELQRLNPELRQGTTPPGNLYGLKVPLGSAPDVERVLEDIRASRSPKAVRAARLRGRAEPPAERYTVSLADVVRSNALPEGSRVTPEDSRQFAHAP